MNVTVHAIPYLGLIVEVIEVATADRRIGNIAGTAAKGLGERLGPLVAVEAIARPTVAGSVNQRIVCIGHLFGGHVRLAVRFLAVTGIGIVGIDLALRTELLN